MNINKILLMIIIVCSVLTFPAFCTEITIEDANFNIHENIMKNIEAHGEQELETLATEKGELYEVTAYDLSVQCCGKTKASKSYGQTASGYSLVGKTWKTARTVAVDPELIPLGSKIYISFTDERYKKYNGIYTARDTGNAVNGNVIDFFRGDFDSEEVSQEAVNFGRTEAKVIIVE